MMRRRKVFSTRFRILFCTTLTVALLINSVLNCWQSAQAAAASHRFYSHFDQYQTSKHNPVIIIPGLLGSALTNLQQESIWGQVSLTSDFTQLALPLYAERELKSERLMPGKVLPSLKASLFGWRFEQELYHRILDALGGGDCHAANRTLNKIDNDFDICFQFPYDWRQDNVKNTQRLHAFILEKREYLRQQYKKTHGIDNQNIKFDIVAHSMGGLLTRYFLRYGGRDLPKNGELPVVTWEGARYVDRVILVAPPNAGSINGFTNLAYGTFVNFPNFFSEPVGSLGVLAGRVGIGPANLNSNLAVLSTFPSLYQMLPRTRHQPVLIAGGNGSRMVANLFQVELWEKMQWGIFAPKAAHTLKRLLPDVANSSERRRIARNMVARNLKRAEQFTQALDQPAQLPPGLNLQLLAGNGVLTAQTIEVDRSGQFKLIKMAPGDGTVTKASALLDEYTEENRTAGWQFPIPWKHVNFYPQDHLKLVKNFALIDHIMSTLLEG